jgi:hypothetical protein
MRLALLTQPSRRRLGADSAQSWRAALSERLHHPLHLWCCQFFSLIQSATGRRDKVI